MTPPPDIWCCRTVELAVRVLPAEHRQRYGLEFIAELYGMPKAQQRRHSARVLTSAWELRTALSEAAPGANGETTASLRHLEELTERLGRHGDIRTHIVMSTQYEGRPVGPVEARDGDREANAWNTAP